ncbi:MAG: PVC-type heme-binding CxxCH protein [Verrucomicrobiota bacterium]
MSPVRLGLLATRCLVLLLGAGSAFAGETVDTTPLPPTEAARRMNVPPGFRVTLFAGEPDLVQPIAMATDDRGRLWVVECLSYPNWQPGGQGRDRVIILDDTDGDGRFDRKSVFWDKGRNLTGIALGFGGVWLCSAPELIFLPDRNRDDVPDGPPQVMLDGWTVEAKHNIVNGLNWGPDGWLYGCHGILADSKIGTPGTPETARTVLNCSVWRFHPTRRQFEVVARGMTNPWGVTWDDFGQTFVANCVIKHLFHIIPGGRYERMYGQDDNPYAFHLMESCADHLHWAGGFWKTEGAGGAQNDAAGGGHAHSGAMVYLGNNWPEEYRNHFFTLNVHGRRINQDILEQRGSGYVAHHGRDLLLAEDPWFRGVALTPAADGGVYISDWSDAGECHDYEDIHRENGRVYKMTHGTPNPFHGDLSKLPDAELVRLQESRNDWIVGQARRLLQERAATGKLESATAGSLVDLLRAESEVTRQLRVLWCLHAIGGLNPDLCLKLLQSKEDWLRAWAIQLSLESTPRPAALLPRLVALANTESSPVVRRYLASALQHLSLVDRPPLARALSTHAEDATDPNLPWLVWYGSEPFVAANPNEAAALLRAARIPVLREFIAQRVALRESLNELAVALSESTDAAFQRDVARGVFQALNGRRGLATPQAWPQAAERLRQHPDAEVREQGVLLSLIFGESGSVGRVREIVGNPALSASVRQRALQGLVQARVDGLVKVLQGLLQDRPLRGAAIRGLAAFDDPTTPKPILDLYAGLSPEERADAITTLASRPAFAIALLHGVKQGAVPAKDISPFMARQIKSMEDPRIGPLVAEVLGEVRGVDHDKAGEIVRFKQLLGPEKLRRADRSHGRALFQRTCAACHTLFGEGGRIAPELTGSQRSNLDYLLENVVDPNAVVWKQYRATYFETRDDRLISGIVLRENESTITIQTQTGTETLARGDITGRNESTLSMMPEGLLQSLGEREVIDLIAYLQSPAQVPLE